VVVVARASRSEGGSLELKKMATTEREDSNSGRGGRGEERGRWVRCANT
jgi:hypothetical protein